MTGVLYFNLAYPLRVLETSVKLKIYQGENSLMPTDVSQRSTKKAEKARLAAAKKAMIANHKAAIVFVKNLWKVRIETATASLKKVRADAKTGLANQIKSNKSELASLK
ncbi:MAG: hypothetical protein [Phormidium phage MIS-PhV1A]|uniref:hypothetical protein n=1 Tax=Phormidium phage MIS-PhV1A TaxID=1391455 RepID=UPI0003C98AA9|nr:MAG: hypothetical protein AV945_gp29 [Phormidium phage MIS-PhV1A]AGZ61774.1 MAG: hypothetical protein [Phormidium phage MIS-PhV1A]